MLYPFNDFEAEIRILMKAKVDDAFQPSTEYAGTLVIATDCRMTIASACMRFTLISSTNKITEILLHLTRHFQLESCYPTHANHVRNEMRKSSPRTLE